MAYNPLNPNGQATMANSQPVVIASNQSNIPFNLVQVGGSSFALGQQLAAASLPIVLTASQLTTLTPPTTITANIGTTNGLALDATLTNGTQQTKLTDATNIANILKSDGTAAGQNSLLTANSFLEVAFTTTSVQAVGTTDVKNYSWVSVHQTSTGGSSTTTFQGSNDNTNWVSVALQQPLQIIASPVTTTAGNGIFAGPINFRYFRLNVTGIVSGTTAGTIEFFSNPRVILSPGGQFALNGTSTTQGAKTTNTNPPGATNIGVLAAQANTAQQSWSDGNEVILSTNLKGSLRTIIQDAALNDRGVNINANNELQVIDQGLRPAGTVLNTTSNHLTTNTTTTLTSSTAYISSIVISTEVGGTTSTVTIQDKQGTPLKLVNGLTTTAVTSAPTTINLQTPVKMVSGIDVITAGAVAATIDVWVNYYQ